jgi:hypothetical protein
MSCGPALRGAALHVWLSWAAALTSSTAGVQQLTATLLTVRVPFQGSRIM